MTNDPHPSGVVQCVEPQQRSLGTLLSERIKELGVSQAAIRKGLEAQGVGGSRSALWNWLNDVNRPSHTNLRALLDVLMVFGVDRLPFYEAAGGEVSS